SPPASVNRGAIGTVASHGIATGADSASASAGGSSSSGSGAGGHDVARSGAWAPASGRRHPLDVFLARIGPIGLATITQSEWWRRNAMNDTDFSPPTMGSAVTQPNGSIGRLVG